MLRIKKLIVHYGPFIALNEISLEIKEGEIVALIGPNKAGKTTLLLTLLCRFIFFSIFKEGCCKSLQSQR